MSSGNFQTIHDKLIIAISSRALFHLEESNQIFESEGLKAYTEYQIENENNPLQPGVAFSLVNKLLKLNQYGDFIEVILLSRNNTAAGLRIFNSIEHHNLAINRAVFTNGNNRYKYVKAFGAHLFLSANHADVEAALSAGCAAATILDSKQSHHHDDVVRIALDGDAVIFSNQSDLVYREKGEQAFNDLETELADLPLDHGPFGYFLSSLHGIQKHFDNHDICPIRTALVTARQAPAHTRVIKTLRTWDVQVDEAIFLGGLDKTEFLHAFGADIYFDDQGYNCDVARAKVATGHVPQTDKVE